MKIGFLPLYVMLYDEGSPGVRPRLEAFYEEVAGMFEEKGIEVVRSSFCRLEDEFAAAVKSFEAAEVDAIVTLHMAYSPSLESIDALSGTKLPVVVFDTTATLEFTNMQSSGEVMYCHGIHGVMDMCSMLKRRGKDYAIVAGHYTDGCLDSVINHVRMAKAAKALSGARVAMLGGLFDGMGDFRVSNKELKKRFGIEVLEKKPKEMLAYEASVTDEEIAAEYALDKERYDFDENVAEEDYLKALKSCLAVRKCIEKEKLTAFTANFRTVGPGKTGLNAMPFLEACKGMARGIGYAGEGDPLTAAFTGALLQGFADTSFVEIFCPDWKNDLLFLSHMGEVNYGIINSKPYIKRSGKNYGEGELPIAGYARMKGGKATFVNICRDAEDYKLVLSDVEMQEYSEDNFATSVRGWMKLGTTCSDFLEKYSENGATHHSILVYGANARELSYFAKLIGVNSVII